jgi:DnaJ-class molecular chaperone
MPNEIPTQTECLRCHGSGSRAGETCDLCHGTGAIPVTQYPPGTNPYQENE